MKLGKSAGASLVLLALLSPLAAGGAEEEPRWEVGAGVAALDFPAYRGAARSAGLVLPFPYFTYHGEVLKADRRGLRASLFGSGQANLNLSLAASPPFRSVDAPARAGMPELKPTLEFGPQLELTLWRSETGARTLKLRLPLRAAFTVESSPRRIGWILSPNLDLDIADLPQLPGWKLGMAAGPMWASRAQHRYFYGVAPPYAGPSRPAYEAGPGYSGSQVLLTLSKRYPGTWVGAFIRYDSLAGAAFEDSPLVQKRHAAAAGIGVAWILGESKIRVRVEE